MLHPKLAEISRVENLILLWHRLDRMEDEVENIYSGNGALELLLESKVKE